MTHPVLRLEGVGKRFWRGMASVDVLRDVSLELEKGEFGAVWGRRGSGRTTLLEIAAGLQAPDAGRVLFNGRDLAELKAPELGKLLRTEIGITNPLGPANGSPTVERWVGLAVLDRLGRRESKRRAQAVLSRVGAGDVGGACWAQLSDTQRTLVSIAHAIVREPTLLLVDDPNGTLGLIECETVLELLRSLARDAGVAVLMTASDVSEANGARPIWSLGAGRIVGRAPREAGTVVEFPVRNAAQSG